MEKPAELSAELRARVVEEVERLVATGSLEDLTLKKVRKAIASALVLDMRPHKKFVKETVVACISKREEAERREEELAAETERLRAIYGTGGRPPSRRAASRRAKRVTSTTSKKRKGGRTGGGFQAPVQLSQPLIDLFDGVSVMPRTEVSKKLWAYIKKHGLQDPSNGRVVLPDERLAKVLGEKPVNMFQMTKVVSKQLYPIDDDGDDDDDDDDDSDDDDSGEEKEADAVAKKAKKKTSTKKKTKKTAGKRKVEVESDDDLEPPPRKKAKKEKKKREPRVLTVSDELAALVGGKQKTRSEVLKALWAYAKTNGLQDGKHIRLDSTLAALFSLDEDETIVGLRMATFVKPHLEG